jgi:signal transduction histidine kinase
MNRGLMNRRLVNRGLVNRGLVKRDRMFRLTRWRLASLYTGVMGLILSLCSVPAYQMMVDDHWQTIDQKIESLAATLHDGLEPSLNRPGQLEPIVGQFLPGLCLVTTSPAATDCAHPPNPHHILGINHQEDYYIRFLDPAGHLLATVGKPPQNPPHHEDLKIQPGWQTFQTSDGDRYRQISVLLAHQSNAPWGYVQIGRSLQQLDSHLVRVRLTLLIGLPMALLLVGIAGWWLAGLAMQPIYQSYQQIQQFTADAAHELRTPLSAIQATVESSLQEEDLTLQESRSTLQTVERQSTRLARLVQDLLLLARMEEQPLKLQSFCLNDLITDLLEGFSALAIAADLSLVADIQTRHPLYVLGDEEQLYRLAANLVMNALQHTPAGGKVTLSLLQQDSFALVRVADTGVGIADSHQRHIFDRFYRVSFDRSRQTGGSGLGLAIAWAIAQAHHGTLQVQSQLAQGSLFTLQLPLMTRPS